MVQSDLLFCLNSDLGEYHDDPITQKTCDVLKKAFFSKFEPKGISKEAKDAALDAFHKGNETCGLRDPCDDRDRKLLFLFEQSVHSLLGWRFEEEVSRPFFRRIAEALTPGPGSSRGHNNESFFEKFFVGPISYTTPDVLARYRASLFMTSPTWAAAEWQRHCEFGEIQVAGNSLFYVSKKQTIARICCTEPGVNMLFQRAIAVGFVDERLKEWGIDLSVQPNLNKSLARHFSITDGGFTIDLENASNSVSCDLVDRYLPHELALEVNRFRSPSTYVNGTEVKLRMISTMGNGLTFSLMTAFLCSAIRASYLYEGLTFDVGPNKKWGVFGDDVIGENSIRSSLDRLIYLIGFDVNVSKSFYEGPFRESCGGDYYRGFDVRGVYCRSLDSDASVYSIINRLNRWSTRTGVLLVRTVSFLIGLLKRKPLMVPRYEGDDAGLHSPMFLVDRPVTLQGIHYVALRNRVISRKINCDSPEYLAYNWGLAVTLQGGYLQTDVSLKPVGAQNSYYLVLTYRPKHGVRRYSACRFASPYWDWVGNTPHDDMRRDDSWGAVVWLNAEVAFT